MQVGDEVAIPNPDRALASFEAAAAPSLIGVLTKHPETGLAFVVSKKRKDLAEIVKEFDEFFNKVADARNLVAMLIYTLASHIHTCFVVG